MTDHYHIGKNPVTDGLLGLAVGDAFGVPVEFMSREEVRRLDLRDMAGSDCGHGFSSRWSDLIPRGAWSDDTSMTVAAMASVVANRGKIDYEDIMRRFLLWWDGGEYSSLEFPFGLGTGIGRALERFRRGVPALRCGGTGFGDNGNGALMRIFPFSMHCVLKGLDDEQTAALIRDAASITHAHPIAALSCLIYTFFLRECLRMRDPAAACETALKKYEPFYRRKSTPEAVTAHNALLGGRFDDLDPDSIPESGYTVDTLAVSLYSLSRTRDYEDAVRLAVSFGYDTDTNAAVTGSVAGVLYGRERIPDRWLDVLKKKDELIRIGDGFFAWTGGGSGGER